MSGNLNGVGNSTYANYQTRQQFLEKQLEDQLNKRLQNIRTRMSTQPNLEIAPETGGSPSQPSGSGGNQLDITA